MPAREIGRVVTEHCRIVRDRQEFSLRYRTARRVDSRQAALEICRDQVIRPPAPANIYPCGSGTDQVTVAIERIQQPGLIGAGIRLDSPQCIFRYEE